MQGFQVYSPVEAGKRRDYFSGEEIKGAVVVVEVL
jgi:hypothetical protein